MDTLAYSLTCTDSPKEPHNLMFIPTVASISVSWEHDSSCFEDNQFEFIVTWQKADTSNDSKNMTVNGTTVIIQDLEPNANYEICVTAVSTSDGQLRSEKKCRPIKTLQLSGKTVYIICGR